MEDNIHFFSRGERATDQTVLDSIGIRGREAMALASVDVPILPGFVIDSRVASNIKSASLKRHLKPLLQQTEQIAGKAFGDPERPMLVKIVISPSLVIATNPVLHNFGLTDDVLPGFMSFVGEHFAHQEVLFLLSGMLQIETQIAELEGRPADHKEIEAARRALGKQLHSKVTPAQMRATVAKYTPLLPKGFFKDSYSQLEITLQRLSFLLELDAENQEDTAILIQPMVYGNFGEDSASGNFFTRNIVTGEAQLQGSFFRASFDDVDGGEGSDISRIDKTYREQLNSVARNIEDHFREIRSVRFTIEDRKLWIVDQRGVMSKSTQAEIQTLLDLKRRKVVDGEYVVTHLKPGQLNEILHPVVDASSVGSLKSIGGGVAGAPGAAIGRIFFSTPALLDEFKRAQQQAEDTRLILCMPSTYADDVKAIEVAAGVMSSEGGYAAHASVVARQYGKVSLVQPEMKFSGNKVTMGDVTFTEGDYITLSVAFFGDPVVYRGKAGLIEPDPETSGLIEFLDVVDTFVGDFHVRANADTPRDAALAQRFGAGGIGLCRTEHMFFHETRINVFRQLIMADGVEARRKVLDKLLPMQRSDFYKLLKIMAGKPVTVRLLDAPLHEFLPHNDEELRAFMKVVNAGRKKRITDAEVRERSEALHEFNPMLGHRGCRLAVSYPEIYEMQVRALFEAVYTLSKEGIGVSPEIMIPLIMNENELKLIVFGKKIEGGSIRGLVEVEEEVRKRVKADPVEYKIGTMIELPVAALSAGSIAKYAQFFSFGTNDLTQTTMGLSRDDYTSFMPDYTMFDILDGNPFQVLNEHVKELVAIAHRRGSLTRPDLKTGLCGEHGAIPENIRFCMETGLSYVSCSSYSVPIAKLAVAQLNVSSGAIAS